MLPDWTKNEDIIYEKYRHPRSIGNGLQTGIDDFRNHYIEHIRTRNESWSEGIYYAGPSSWYVDIPQGIEMDNNNLQPISVVIGNWERQFYLPMVLEAYHNQDYPRNLLEIMIIDDNSVDKNGILKIIKEQIKLYPDLKIRFVENYINKTYSGAGRANFGVRHATHNIVIVNESDFLPIGKNYLRGVCYAHNRFDNVSCMGLPFGFGSLEIMNKEQCLVNRRFGEGVYSVNKGIFCKIRGYDERHKGWGGHEGNMYDRYINAGGKIFINLYIYAGSLTNFPVPLPSGVTPAAPGGDDWQRWQPGQVINDESWGLTERYEEINLYI